MVETISVIIRAILNNSSTSQRETDVIIEKIKKYKKGRKTRKYKKKKREVQYTQRRYTREEKRKERGLKVHVHTLSLSISGLLRQLT